MTFDTDRFQSLFSRIYSIDSSKRQKQNERYEKLTQQYSKIFENKDVHYFSTPGRTEIGGNHTDHNHGRVLAASVNLDAIAAASTNNSNEVVLYSEGFDKPFIVDFNTLKKQDSETGTTNALIRGIASRFKALGYHIGGFNACVSSDVLQGSGLSSSAAIEILIGTILNAFYNENKIDPKELAIIGQYAENEFFGKPCGLMDQMACAVGGIVTIDFKDPGNPVVEKVDFDFIQTGYQLVVVDTGGNHADLTDDYASVPTEMKSVAREMGGEVCRDFEKSDLLTKIKSLRSKTGDRAILRAFHFLNDNHRVTEQVEALKANDFSKFLSLVTASGNSSFKYLQNIYTTKNVAEQGVSLALALTEDFLSGIEGGACRVHGGGFAGTIQVFLPRDALSDYIDMIESVFGKGSALVLSIRPTGTIHLNDFLI